MQPKKKSDCLVHNVYIVQCHLRPAQQKSVHLDFMHVQASSRRGNKLSVLREPHQRMLGVDDLGKAEISYGHFLWKLLHEVVDQNELFFLHLFIFLSLSFLAFVSVESLVHL